MTWLRGNFPSSWSGGAVAVITSEMTNEFARQITKTGDDMASTIQQANITGFAALVPSVAGGRLEQYQETFEQNRHRVYALAFWVTDHELAAEELMKNAFYRAFLHTATPSSEAIDRAFVTEVRELMPVGVLTLEAATCNEVVNVRRNLKRVHLERAVVQLPTTEKLIFLMHDVEGYDHARVARTLGIAEEESQLGLHAARLRMRELVARMN